MHHKLSLLRILPRQRNHHHDSSQYKHLHGFGMQMSYYSIQVLMNLQLLDLFVQLVVSNTYSCYTNMLLNQHLNLQYRKHFDYLMYRKILRRFLHQQLMLLKMQDILMVVPADQYQQVHQLPPLMLLYFPYKQLQELK